MTVLLTAEVWAICSAIGMTFIILAGWRDQI